MRGSQVSPPQSSPLAFESWLAACLRKVVLGPVPTECPGCLGVRHSRVALFLSKGAGMDSEMHSRKVGSELGLSLLDISIGPLLG